MMFIQFLVREGYDNVYICDGSHVLSSTAAATTAAAATTTAQAAATAAAAAAHHPVRINRNSVSHRSTPVQAVEHITQHQGTVS